MQKNGIWYEGQRRKKWKNVQRGRESVRIKESKHERGNDWVSESVAVRKLKRAEGRES